ncbi:hypothetical protein GW932_03350 [archaeon]|nr:hypothetical protein [archaeon]
MKAQKGLFAVLAVALLGVGLVSAFGWVNGENYDSIESAIEAGDFQAWKEAHLSQLTEENFNLAVDRHAQMIEMRDLMDSLRDARESGDTDLVSELETQLEALRPEGFNGMKGPRGDGFSRGNARMPMNGECPYSD